MPALVLSSVSAVATFSFLSLGFMAGKRSTSLMPLEAVRNVVTRSMPMASQPWGKACIPGRCRNGFLVTSSSGLGLVFKKLPLPQGIIQPGVGTSYFLLHDKQLKALSPTLFRAVPFGQRAHCLRVIMDECRIDTCHSKDSPTSLSRSLALDRGRGHSTALPHG